MIRPKASIGQEYLAAHITENPALGATTAVPYGTAGGFINSGSTIYPAISTSGFTIPIVGTFLVVNVWNGSVTSNPTYSLGANITRVNLLVNDTVGLMNVVAGGTCITVQILKVSMGGTTGANFVIVTSGLAGLTAGTADVFITRISPDLMLREKPQDNMHKMLDAFLRMRGSNYYPKDNLLLDSPVIVEEHKEQPTGITNGTAPSVATPSRYRMF
jgi:hypothetical protein